MKDNTVVHPARTGDSVTLAAAVVALACGAARAQLQSTFDTTTEGWQVVAFPYSGHVANPPTTTATFDSTFGFPAGSLRIGDVYGDTGIVAPAAWIGDKSAYYGGSLTFDMLIRYTDGVVYPTVALNAGTFTLYYPLPSPALNVQTTRTIPLTEAGWKVNSYTTGAPATQAHMQQALAALSGLYIYTEWRTGPDDTTVDNIFMVPGNLCDPIDFNQDGLFPDTQDINDFLEVFAGGVCPTGTCLDIDYNNDGLFPDTLDIQALLSVFSGGACLQ